MTETQRAGRDNPPGISAVIPAYNAADKTERASIGRSLLRGYSFAQSLRIEQCIALASSQATGNYHFNPRRRSKLRRCDEARDGNKLGSVISHL